MSGFPRPCTRCGRRVENGVELCPVCTSSPGRFPIAGSALPSEPRPYDDPDYRRNRALRYKIAGGRCELCHRPVKRGEWECDHVIPVVDWIRRKLAGSPHRVGNLRILCTVEPNRCHHLKTREDRMLRADRRRS